MARALKFTEAAIPVISEESGISRRAVQDMYVARPEVTYYFVIDLPHLGNSEVGWAMIPDFTFEEFYEFAEPAKDDAFVEITKLKDVVPA